MITDSGVSRRITNMLLEWLGDRKRRSFIVGATNFLDNMDSAFIRAGRVDEIILVLPPDNKARKEILRIHSTVMRKIPMPKNPEALFEELAEKTVMWTGAELEKLCLDAARIAMEQKAKIVGKDQFEEAWKGFDVNTEERTGNIDKMVTTMKKTENVSRAFLDNALKAFRENEPNTDVTGKIESMLDSL